MENAWETIAAPIRDLSVPELRKLKTQYKHFKEIKSRHITDMQGILEVFGLLATVRSQTVDGDEEQKNQVKFEEEPYEDEDWFLMLISELIFDKL